MSLKIRDRDYVPDGAGGFQRASGAEMVLEEAMFQLVARRGSFPLMPEVGSRLHTLYREKPSDRAEMARAYVGEALEPMGIRVTDVTLTEGEVLMLEIGMIYEGETMNLEVAVN